MPRQTETEAERRSRLGRGGYGRAAHDGRGRAPRQGRHHVLLGVQHEVIGDVRQVRGAGDEYGPPSLFAAVRE